LVALHLLWEGLVRWLDVSPWKLPAPSMIFQAAREHADVVAEATLVTSQAALGGFAASLLVGVVAGVLLSTTRLVERAFYPFTVFLQTVPLVAIAPLLVLWVGPGTRAVAVSAFIVSLFPVIANTLAGMRSTAPPASRRWSSSSSRPRCRTCSPACASRLDWP
jgi:NitT/TauT family transport system permease protein